mgnify:CR=1 FL=1
MIIKSAELETVCGITSTLPETEMPEIAFAGKSNVGKSSLINGLLNRKSLARTSSQPGKTQTINYYNINHDLYFVDLPGYGYAQVSVEIRAKWGKMVERYLHTSKQLRLVFLLIDIRHEPSENDCIMYDWIVKNGYEPVIIATKLDKMPDPEESEDHQTEDPAGRGNDHNSVLGTDQAGKRRDPAIDRRPDRRIRINDQDCFSPLSSEYSQRVLTR